MWYQWNETIEIVHKSDPIYTPYAATNGFIQEYHLHRSNASFVVDLRLKSTKFNDKVIITSLYIWAH